MVRRRWKPKNQDQEKCRPLGKASQRGWVCHLRMIFWQKDKLLRFEGGLGPLQDMAVQGKMDWKIESAEKGASRLVLTCQVWGPLSASF